MNTKSVAYVRCCIAVATAVGFGGCRHDECSLNESPCGEAEGTYVVCEKGGGPGHTPSLNEGGNYFVVRECEGLQPVCRRSGNDGHVCVDTAPPATACTTTTVLADAPGEYITPTVADLNGDGRPDLLLASFAEGHDSLWQSLQSMDGSFSAPTEIRSDHGEYRAPVVGDVDGDGRVDVVATRLTEPELGGASPSEVVVLLARGQEFVPTASMAFPPEEHLFVTLLADLDGDGTSELLLGIGYDLAVFELRGDALIERTRWTNDFDAYRTWGGVETADFAGDGRRFVLVQVNVSTMSLVRAFAPDGRDYAFAPEVKVPVHAAYADFDGDGATDFAASDLEQRRPSVTLELSTRDGDFTTRTLLRLPYGGYLAAGEVDGDAGLDLVAVHGAGRVSVVLDAAAPGEHEARTFDTGVDGVQALLADLDGDGRADLVWGRNRDMDSILRGTPVPPAVVANFGTCL